MILNDLTISGVQQKVFYQIRQKGFEQMGLLRQHKPICVATPRKLQIPLMFHGGSCSRMTEMHFFQGLSPVGIN